MLFLVAEVTRSLSNLYKSGFISYSGQNTLVIDANKNRVVRDIEEQQRLLQQQGNADSDNADSSEDSGDGFQSFEIENIDMENVRQEADAVFEEARIAAEKILEEAKAEALILKEEAKQNGAAEGYQKGMEDAKLQFQAQEEELQNRYESMQQQLEADYERQLSEAEPKLVEIVCKLIHKITGVFVADQQEVLVHIIDNALRDVENVDKVVIKVSEDDYANVYSRFDWLQQQVNSNVEVELVSDAKLSKLECLIETDNGIMNCGLDEQLDHLATSLRLLAQV